MTVSVNGTTGITFNDASIQNTAATGFGFKNRIINGAMQIDQRNAGAAKTSLTSQYLVDRWIFAADVGGKFTFQQNYGSVTPPAGFSNYSGFYVASAYTPSGNEISVYQQAIEGFNFADLAWGTASAASVTLSFWVRSSLTGTFGGAFRNSAATRSYPFSYTISAANTWEQKSITITGDTSGTWIGATNGTGVYLDFDLGSANGAYRGTANAWATTTGNGYIGVTNSVQVVANAGATFYITGVQLEKGSTATSFDYRPYGTELALCQRYYEKSYLDAVAVPSNTEIGAFAMRQTGVNAVATIIFTESKRADPTMVYYSTQDSATSNAYDTNAGVNVSMSSLLGGQRSNSFVISGTAGNYLRFQWSSSAEL